MLNVVSTAAFCHGRPRLHARNRNHPTIPLVHATNDLLNHIPRWHRIDKQNIPVYYRFNPNTSLR